MRADEAVPHWQWLWTSQKTPTVYTTLTDSNLLWIKIFLKRPNRLKSIFWDMGLVSAPVSNLAHQPAEAAAQPAIAAADKLKL